MSNDLTCLLEDALCFVQSCNNSYNTENDVLLEMRLRAAVDIYKAESSEDDGEIVKGGKYLCLKPALHAITGTSKTNSPASGTVSYPRWYLSMKSLRILKTRLRWC